MFKFLWKILFASTVGLCQILSSQRLVHEEIFIIHATYELLHISTISWRLFKGYIYIHYVIYINTDLYFSIINFMKYDRHTHNSVICSKIFMNETGSDCILWRYRFNHKVWNPNMVIRYVNMHWRLFYILY